MKKKHTFHRLLYILIILFSFQHLTTATAELPQPNNTWLPIGFFVSANFGYFWLSNRNQTHILDVNGPIILTTTFPQNDGGVGRASIGANFLSYIGAETGYEQFTSFRILTTGTNTTATLNSYISAHIWDVDILMRLMWPVFNGFYLVAKGGMAIVHTAGNVTRVAVAILLDENENIGSTVIRPKVVGGFGYRLNTHFLFEVIYSRIFGQGTITTTFIPEINTVKIGFVCFFK